MALTDKEFKSRLAAITTKELLQPERWHWVSFADDDKGGFKGAVVIKGHGMTDCLSKCHRLGINPGGQVLCILFPDGETLPPPTYRNRLLTRGDIMELYPDAKTIGEFEAEAGQ